MAATGSTTMTKPLDPTTDVADPRDAPEALARAALGGDAHALDRLLRQVEPTVFRLALRMLGRFADAEDATQEILVKVATSLATFGGRSRFTTWVHAIAANHLRDQLRGSARHEAGVTASLDELAERLDQGMAATAALPLDLAADPALALEARETGLRCTQGMLMYLDPEHRLALLLTEVFGLSGAEAAQVLDISHDALRQRCARAKRTMEEFLEGRCSRVDPAGSCRCERMAQARRLGGGAVPIEFCARPISTAAQPAAVHAARDELVLIQRYAEQLRADQAWQASPALHSRLRAVIAASPVIGGRS